MRLTLLAGIIFLASCASTPSNPVLPLPPELRLPTIEATELACLPDETYGKLVERDVMMNSRIQTLQSIIKATH